MDKLKLVAPDPELIEALLGVVGTQNVSTSPVDRVSYARDYWVREIIYLREGKVPHPPDVIVWPESAEKVARLLEIARQYKTCLIPYGAGSGVAGGTVPVRGGIIVDMKKMDQILFLDDSSLTVDVQTGILGQRLEMELNRRGYTMGHFPSSIYCSTLGGYLAGRSAGQLSTKYGKIEDMVLAMEVVLPSGKIFHTVKTPRAAAGPDMNQIFAGSEGTLGIITTATMKIWPYPESVEFRAFKFKDVDTGAKAISKIMRTGIRPAVVRLYDQIDTIIGLAKKKESEHDTKGRSRLMEEPPKFSSKILGPVMDSLSELKIISVDLLLKKPKKINELMDNLPVGCLLILGFEGDKQLVQTELKISCGVCEELNGKDLGPGPGQSWYDHRYRMSYFPSKVLDAGFFFDTIEVATTWENLMPLYKGMKGAIGQHALVMAHFSHAYPQGCSIYFSFMAEAKNDGRAREKYDMIWKSAMDACSVHSSAISHHHGVGVLKAQWMAQELGAGTEVLSALKKSLDPDNILNPGKLGL